MNKIINFHVVSDMDWFERVILFLKSNHRMVSIETVHEYMLGRIDSNNLCHITVDDGDISFYKTIFPVLKKYNIHATLFVSPRICSESKNFWFQEIVGYDKTELRKVFSEMFGVPYEMVAHFDVEMLLKSQAQEQIHRVIRRYQVKMNVRRKEPQNMSIDDLLEVRRSGLVTIGAHTINHPILRNESDFNSEAEICESVTQLSNILGSHISYFSYPNGIQNLDFSEREEAALTKANVDLAFTTESANFHSANHRYRIPRIGISDKENFLFFKTKMLMSRRWESIIKLNKNNEQKQRRKIQKLLSAMN